MKLGSTLKSTFSKALGKQLANWVARAKKANSGRFLETLNEKLNLEYLAERLMYEQSAIEDYTGDIQRLSSQRQDLISIITPVYGIKLKYIRQFVRSVQNQSYRNWELCICIDGESDSKIQRYFRDLNEETPNRIRLVVHEQNQGICTATKSALGLAKGNLIAFVDADDLLHKDALAAITRAFSSDETIDLVYTNNDILTPWGYRIDPLYKPAWSPELLLNCNYIVHLVAVRRALLDQCGNLWSADLNGAQDWNVLLRAGKLARRVHHIPIVLYHWRAHESSMSGTANAKPWAWDAATCLMENYVAELDERLYWDWSHDQKPAPLRIRNKSGPQLTVVELETDQQSYSNDCVMEHDYSGDITCVKAKLRGTTLRQQAASLDEIVSELSEKDSVLLFYCAEAEKSELVGPLDTLVAFGILPGVACSWPFYDQWRGIYTVCDDFLSPKLRQSSFYTALSGNVLTGPLHGLMIERSVLMRLGGFGACCPESVPQNQPVQALGALLGLHALDKGLRNVSVQAVKSDWRAPVLDLANETPAFDPYL